MPGSFRKDLFHFLRGVAKEYDAGISWGFSADDTTYPRIVLRLAGDRPDHHTRGMAGSATANVSVSVYAKATHDRSASRYADEIADRIEDVMDRHPGPMGGTHVASIELNDRFQVEEQPNDKGDWIFGIVLDYDIAHGVAARAEA